MRKLLSILAFIVVSLLAVSMVSAVGVLPVAIEQLKINGEVVLSGENPYFEKGKTLDIKVKVRSTLVNGTSQDVRVAAEIDGYEYSDHESLEDSTPVFDLEAGDTRWVDLSIQLPQKLEKDLYLLRVRVTDRNSNEVSQTYNLKINPGKHALEVKDVIFSPGTTLKIGQSLLATVLVNNLGSKPERNVKVTLDIPQLGVSASGYIDQINSGNKKTSEELFVKLPRCAAAGDYKAKVTVQYREYETATKEYDLHLLENEQCTVPAAGQNKLVIMVGLDSQNVVANQQAAYPIALTNAGTASKTYLLELTAGDWATSQVSENLVVLEAGKTKVVYAYLTAKTTAAAGEKIATLNVKADNNVLQTLYLKANVVPQESSFNLRNGIEIALVILVVILVIIGLVIGFTRLKKDESNEEDKTYY